MAFADNLAVLPPVDHLAAIELIAPDGRVERIDNRPGSAGSVRLYAWLAGKYGVIGVAAAAEGIALYAEHSLDAQANPGKHANIDRLLALHTDDQAWRIRPIPTTL